MKKLSLMLVAFSILGCTSNSKDGIAGKWKMNKVIQEGQDVTEEHNPHHERYLILKPDSLFESGGRPFGKNTGKYSFNEEENKLFLDSDAGPDDDSYWIVRISGDTMFWQGYGSEWAENFQLIQIRNKK